jgi:hypothetical protein
VEGDAAINFCEDLLIEVGGEWERIWGGFRSTGHRVRGHDES